MAKTTRAMLTVLRKLAEGDWVMGNYGRDGLQAILLRRKGEDQVVSAKTVSRLHSEGLIRSTGVDITDWRITDAGKALVAK